MIRTMKLNAWWRIILGFTIAGFAMFLLLLVANNQQAPRTAINVLDFLVPAKRLFMRPHYFDSAVWSTERLLGGTTAVLLAFAFLAVANAFLYALVGAAIASLHRMLSRKAT